MQRLISVAAISASLFLGVSGASKVYAADNTVKVMTQNMDAGTDLKLAVAYINTPTPTVGIDLTYQEILQSNFAARAAILAQEIASNKPDVVSLQEVTLWTTRQPTGQVCVPATLTPLFAVCRASTGSFRAD
jgi:hypothetical protein